MRRESSHNELVNEHIIKLKGLHIHAQSVLSFWNLTEIHSATGAGRCEAILRGLLALLGDRILNLSKPAPKQGCTKRFAYLQPHHSCTMALTRSMALSVLVAFAVVGLALPAQVRGPVCHWFGVRGCGHGAQRWFFVSFHAIVSTVSTDNSVASFFALQARRVRDVPAASSGGLNATALQSDVVITTPTSCGWYCYSDSSCAFFIANTYAVKDVDHIGADFLIINGKSFYTTTVYRVRDGPINFPIYVMPDKIQTNMVISFRGVDVDENTFTFVSNRCTQLPHPPVESPPPPPAPKAPTVQGNYFIPGMKAGNTPEIYYTRTLDMTIKLPNDMAKRLNVRMVAANGTVLHAADVVSMEYAKEFFFGYPVEGTIAKELVQGGALEARAWTLASKDQPSDWYVLPRVPMP